MSAGILLAFSDLNIFWEHWGFFLTREKGEALQIGYNRAKDY